MFGGPQHQKAQPEEIVLVPEDMDKETSWRFKWLVEAGYDLAHAEEMARVRSIDLHVAVERAKEHGALVAFLRFY